jgi:hypothetical protein
MRWLALVAIVLITPNALGGDLGHAQRFGAHVNAWRRARAVYQAALGSNLTAGG